MIIGTAVVAAVAIAARRPRGVSTGVAKKIGWVLIAIPLPLVVFVHITLLHSGPLDQSLFISAALAFAVGAALVLGREEDDDGFSEDGPEPGWWPDFERAFRDYTRDPSARPKVRS